MRNAESVKGGVFEISGLARLPMPDIYCNRSQVLDGKADYGK